MSHHLADKTIFRPFFVRSMCVSLCDYCSYAAMLDFNGPYSMPFSSYSHVSIIECSRTSLIEVHYTYLFKQSYLDHIELLGTWSWFTVLC